MADKKYIEMNIDDALIEKPHCINLDVDGKVLHFYLFPVTLGKMHILKRHIDNLQINMELLKKNMFFECLRIVHEHKEEVARILTYHTLKKKRDIFDYALVEERTKLFCDNSTDEELASMLIVILSKDEVGEYMDHLGITKEQDRLRAFLDAKKRAQKSENNFAFGGKSTYGSLIDVACERYGWSYDYVLWGISYVNLQLLLADRAQSFYVSDEEKKKIPSRLMNNADTINADDKSNMEKILSMDWR